MLTNLDIPHETQSANVGKAQFKYLLLPPQSFALKHWKMLSIGMSKEEIIQEISPTNFITMSILLFATRFVFYLLILNYIIVSVNNYLNIYEVSDKDNECISPCVIIDLFVVIL